MGAVAGVWTRPFATYWSATSLSNVGSGVSLVALPVLAAQELGAGAAQLGYLRALETAPYLLLALSVGRLADRRSPLRLMVVADAGRALLLAGVVGLAAGSRLDLAVLYVAVIAVGALTVTYDVAQFTYLPAIVSREVTVPANAAVELARGAAFTFGPGLGGVLVAALRAGPALLVDALSYVYSAAALATLRRRRLARGAPADAAPVRAGLRFVAAHREMRALTAYLGVNNACTQAFLTGLVAYLEVGRPASALRVGAAFGAYGAGFLLAALAAPAVGRRLGTGAAVVASSLLSAAGAGLVAVGARVPALVVAGAFAVGFAAPLFNVQSVAVRYAVTPPELLGRVGSVVKLVSQGGLPLGALAAGGLFTALRPEAAFGTVAMVSLLATGLLLPVRRRRSVQGCSR
jgi:MFS family permease